LLFFVKLPRYCIVFHKSDEIISILQPLFQYSKVSWYQIF